MSGFRIMGVVLAVVGVLAASFPNAFGLVTGSSEATLDVFETIERRVRGGMVLGLGLIFMGVPALRPWSSSIPLAIFYFMTGALAARILGLLLDGTPPRQWLLVAIEVAVMGGAAVWLWLRVP